MDNINDAEEREFKDKRNQKLSDDLSLAIDIGNDVRAESSELGVGYDSFNDTWELIVKYNGDVAARAEELGGSAVLLLGGYAIVTMPQNMIDRFAAFTEVEYIEKPRRLFYSISQAAARSCIYYAWNEPYKLSGRDTLVAVIDSGIDWNNRDFKNEDGSTRIVRLWDQTVSSEYSGYEPPDGYNVGTEYTREIIDSALSGDETAMRSLRLSRDYSGHGTFVTGIAAGNGRGSSEIYRGVAYESELVIVKLNIQLWKNYADEYGIEITAPSGAGSGQLRTYGAGSYLIDGTKVYVYYGEPTPYSRYQQIYFELVPGSVYIAPGVWKITLTPIRIVDGQYDLWLPDSSTLNEDTRFFFPVEETTLTVPSAADKVITVGAYNSRTDAYADFSGRGYTRLRDNVKPDIVAPGVDIISTAVNGGYTMRSGTSMAVPFVSGSAALMMQWGIVEGNDAYLYGEKIKA